MERHTGIGMTCTANQALSALLVMLLGVTLSGPARAETCAGKPVQTYDIEGSTAEWRQRFIDAAECENTRIRLWPNVEMNFSTEDRNGDGEIDKRTLFEHRQAGNANIDRLALEELLPVKIAQCVTITSISRIEPSPPPRVTPPDFRCTSRDPTIILNTAPAPRARVNPALRGVASVPSRENRTFEVPREPGEARSPKSPGPVLMFGTGHRSDTPFFLVEGRFGQLDHVRISGFRMMGPDLDDQDQENVGIRIEGSKDVIISNMEIAGWGAAAISIVDGGTEALVAGKDAGRISTYDDVRIMGNYLHHNQHSGAFGDSAEGYGVDVGAGAWAHIERNVFDFNRHAIATNGDAGGYWAENNLVLAGGGYHGKWYSERTHQFDAHGTENCTARWSGWAALGWLAFIALVVFIASSVGLAIPVVLATVIAIAGAIGILIAGYVGSDSVHNCGLSVFKINIEYNAFQYDNDVAIKIRGHVREQKGGRIADNVFPHETLVDTVKNGPEDLTWLLFETPAILVTGEQTNVEIFDNNRLNYQSEGQFVTTCDFDADGKNDKFLATGVNWWFQSEGGFWSYLNTQHKTLDQLQLADVDNDGVCDVVDKSDSTAYVSTGRGGWTPRP